MTMEYSLKLVCQMFYEKYDTDRVFTHSDFDFIHSSDLDQKQIKIFEGLMRSHNNRLLDSSNTLSTL